MAVPVITDYHKAVRDAIASTLTALQIPVPVVTLDDPETDLTINTSLPIVAVACVSPEQDRSEMSTNARDGIGYAASVGLFANAVTSGARPPGWLEPTQFRRLVRTTFHNKRLSGVDEVGWCEVSELGAELYGKDSLAFQRLQSGFTVVAIGRWPRTDS